MKATGDAGRRGDADRGEAFGTIRGRLLRSAAVLPVLMIAGLMAAPAQADPSPSACTVTGTTSEANCDSSYVAVTMTPGTGSLTVDGLTTAYVAYVSPLTVGEYNQTVTLTGTTVLNNPSYSALIMQFGTDQSTPPQQIAVTVNATVNIGSDVQATSVGGFGTIWVLNDYAGSIAIDNAGTLTHTADTVGQSVAALSGLTNLGPVTITNSGVVTSTNAWGVYANGNYNGTTEEMVSVTNTGTIDAYTVGVRLISYNGLGTLTNSGTITSSLRQGVIIWTVTGGTELTNSGTITSGNDNAAYGSTVNGDITITNSGTVTAYGDITLDAAHIALTGSLDGFNGLRGTADISGDVTITNEAAGIVTATRDAAILAETPSGDITVTNAGQLTGKYGIVANSGLDSGGSSATVPMTQGDIDVTNSGTITATDLAISLDATTNLLTNSGTITTTGTVAVETGNGDSTVINSGTIAAASASDTAVSMGTGSNRFVLADTATVTGIVTNASTGNTLELTGSASGTFDLDNVNDTGAYRGFGNLEKSGTGTWVLTGESATLTGTVTVSAGTLQVGNGGASGGFAADVSIASGATLTINRADDIVFANVISGTGSLVKDGANTLTLTGDNSFSGVVTINAGTLQIGDGGSTGAIAGDIVNNAALVFNRTGTYDFPGSITGSGSVTILAGTVNFIGASGYTGPIDVAGADLVLTEGSTSSSTFTVTSGGVLSGEGTIAGLSVGNGGSVAPGYSPGTLTVAGNVDFSGGSTYVVDIAADGTHDLILASGTATLTGGAVQVVAESGYVTPLATYTILTASGGVTGTFDTVSSNFAFLTPILGYDASNVYLTLARNDISFASVGQTPNQQATGAGVESLGLGNPVYDAVLSISTTNAPAAFDALSGEAYASVTTIFAQQSSYLREAVGGRVRQGFADEAGVTGPQTAALTPGSGAVLWVQGYGAWGSNSSDGNAASADSNVGGFFAGADIPVGESWRIGLLTGYSRSSIDIDDRGSSADSDNYDLGLYGGARYGALGLLVGASYTWHDVSMSRSIVFPGYAGAASSSYDAATAQLFGEVSWRMPMAQALPGAGEAAFIEPFAGLAYVNLSSDDFTETGSSAALTGSAEDENVFYSTLGIRAATEMELKGGMKARPYLSLGWQYAFGDVDPTASLSFASGSAAFEVSGLPIARNTALVGLGIDFSLSDTVRAGLNYGGQFASDVSDNTFKGSLSIRF